MARTPEERERHIAYMREYRQRPEVKERKREAKRRYRQTSEGREAHREETRRHREREAARKSTPEYRAKARVRDQEYRRRPEVKEREATRKSRDRIGAIRRNRLYRSALPKEIRYQRWIMRKFGLGPEIWARMWREQDGRCFICRDAPIQCVDHDHATGRVRALLCSHCNTAIGLFDEDPDRLRAAATYLEIHASVGMEVIQLALDA